MGIHLPNLCIYEPIEEMVRIQHIWRRRCKNFRKITFKWQICICQYYEGYEHSWWSWTLNLLTMLRIYAKNEGNRKSFRNHLYPLYTRNMWTKNKEAPQRGIRFNCLGLLEKTALKTLKLVEPRIILIKHEKRHFNNWQHKVDQ